MADIQNNMNSNAANAKSKATELADAAKAQAIELANAAKAQAQAMVDAAKAQAQAAADAAKAQVEAVKAQVEAAKAQAKAAADKAKAAADKLKAMAKKPPLPSVPEYPAVPKIQMKEQPTPKKYAKAEDENKKTPPPPPPPSKTGPNGEFITKYKGYSIYKKYVPPNVQFLVRDGEGVIHKGPESRSATDEQLLNYEKKFIDNIPQ
jgi:hypothetical protein